MKGGISKWENLAIYEYLFEACSFTCGAGLVADEETMKVLVILICCADFNISYTQSFRSSKYQFIETKHGIGEVTLTIGSIVKFTL